MRRTHAHPHALRLHVALLAFACIAMPISLHAQDKKQRGDRNRIAASELVEANGSFNTAYDIIRTVRAQWFNLPQGRTSTATMNGDGGGAKELVVYIDDVRQQSVEDLRTVKAKDVVELRYLDQNRAIQMRGPGHELGVIEVTTVNKRK